MIANLKPYSTMKDTGVPWLGELPEHWEVRRGKTLFRCIDIRSETGEEELLTVSSERGVVPRHTANVTMFKAESYLGYKLCWPGDLVINSLWAWARGLGISRYHGIVSSAYGVYRLLNESENHPSFIHELVRSTPFHWELRVRSKGVWTSRLQLTDQSFLEAPFPVPPRDEQLAIVRFLKHYDRRIRRYIRVKQKLIKVLEEEKQAIIHRAVTRGLNPNVSLKSSAVEWLGKIPEHWEMKRCRYLFHEVDKRSADGSEEHLSMSQRLGLVPSHMVENRTLVSENYTGGKLCEVGDLVLNRLKAHLGVFALAQHAGVISPDYTVLRPIDPGGTEYFERVLRSPICRFELRIRAKGIVEGFWRLYTDDFYDIRLPVPPCEERDAIIDFIRKGSAEIQKGESYAEREIHLLREYRTRLIADVVTGKLDVREAVARLPEETEELEPFEEADILTDQEEDTTDDLDAIPEEAEV